MAHCRSALSCPLGLVFCGSVAACALLLAAPYQQLVRESYEAALRLLPDRIIQWRARYTPTRWQEFHPPIEPAAVAGIAAALYEATRQPEYAAVAFRWLALYDTLRHLYPDSLRRDIPQYAQGVPPVPDFFALPVFCRAYLRIRTALPAQHRHYLQQLIAESAAHAVHFPEWGAMNRALLRALGLSLAAQACPEAPQAQQWRRLAHLLLAESRTSWLLEDAQLYWGIGLYALLLYGELVDSTVWHLPQVPVYIEAAFQLMAPFGAVAPFGDTRTPGETAAEFAAVFEWAAARFRRPHYRWAAAQLVQRWLSSQRPVPAYRGLILWDASLWADTSLPPVAPETPPLLWCSEDAIVKKLVFRTGWDTAATYLALTYRDTPRYGWRAQHFLHQSLPIEEEKGSHGHSDELALLWFLYRGSLLLTPPGYREGVPSGPFGAYRAEYFHNRLLVRPARPAAGQSLWEFLRHAGTHRPVQTLKLDAWEFSALTYARLRLTDEAQGYEWERLLVVLHEPISVLVLDIVHFLRDGPFTVAQFWHAGRVLWSEPHRCVLATDSAGGVRGDTAWALGILGLPQLGQRDTLFSLRRFGYPAVAYVRWQAGHYRRGERLLLATYLFPIRRGVPFPNSRWDIAPLPSGISLSLQRGDTLWLMTAQWDVLGGSLGDGRRPQYEPELRTLTAGILRSDADFAFLRQTPTETTYGFTYGSFLHVGTRTAFEAPPNLFPLQLDGSPPRTARLQWRAWEGKLP